MRTPPARAVGLHDAAPRALALVPMHPPPLAGGVRPRPCGRYNSLMLTPHDIAPRSNRPGSRTWCGFPTATLGTWESRARTSKLAPIRVCREGEAIGVAIGLMLGGAKPLVAIQCTGFFEAGDAVRNAPHDLKLPLKLIIGVREAERLQSGQDQPTTARGTRSGSSWRGNCRTRDSTPRPPTPAQLAAAAEVARGPADARRNPLGGVKKP